MKMNSAKLILWVLTIVLVCSVTVPATEGDNISVHYVLEPIIHPAKAGPVVMKFSVEIEETACVRCKCCDYIDMEVITTGGMECLSPKTWTVQPDENRSFATTLTVNIPPKDTSSLRIKMSFRGGGEMAAHVYFVTTGDSVEFWKGYPRARYNAQPDWKPDTTRYEVKIDLRRDRQRERIFDLEDQVGPIVSAKDSGFYIIRITRSGFRALTSEGFKCEYLVEPPPYPPGPAGSKTIWKRDPTIQQRPRKSIRDPQIDGSIWLDHIEGVDAFERIYANQLATFYLGFENNYGDDIQGLSNGFRIYSPDGANWWNTTWDTLGSLDWHDAFDFTFGVWQAGVTGSGADSLRFLGISMFGTGLYDGFSDTAISFTIGPIGSDDIGKTICLDSSWVTGTENWHWSTTNGANTYQPTWYGLECFEVTSPQAVYVTGRLRYRDPTPPYATYEACKGDTVYAWDFDEYSADEFLGRSIVDDNGYFYFGPIIEDDWGGPDIYFTTYSRNEATIVFQEGGLPYMEGTDTTMDVAGGNFTLPWDLTQSQSGPFFVADAVLEGYREWTQLRPGVEDHPDVLTVGLYAYDGNAMYDPNQRIMYLNDSVDVGNRWPDTYNRSTILHEYSHFLAHQNSFFQHGGGGTVCGASWTLECRQAKAGHTFGQLMCLDPMSEYAIGTISRTRAGPIGRTESFTMVPQTLVQSTPWVNSMRVLLPACSGILPTSIVTTTVAPATGRH